VADDEIHFVGRYEWERVLRRCVLHPQPVKTVAAYLAQYANADGTNVRPGVDRLSAVSGLSERSVRSGLTVLRELCLITRTRVGSSLGRQALTDEYRLSYPDDIYRRVHMLDPDESPASAACDQTCQHPGSPARGAADKPPAAAEHRHVVPGTPAPHAGTPAPHDRNTGTTCTPPPNDQPLPPNDQRDDLVSDVTTRDDDRYLYARLVAIDELAARRRGA
jgi:hypothetical protein